MKDILYIIVPAYNESENISSLIEDWYPIVEKHNGYGQSRLVIIDDGSKDNTYDIVMQHTKNMPYLEIIRKENGGHGSSVLYGYRYAIKNNADWIFQTDSDGQTLSSEFYDFWDKRTEHDAIIGNRSSREDGLSRKLVEKVVILLLWLYFGVKVPDSNAPFRLMKKELVEKYIDKLPNDFNLPNIMFTAYFSYFKENIVFQKITFRPRQGGINSININIIFQNTLVFNCRRKQS